MEHVPLLTKRSCTAEAQDETHSTVQETLTESYPSIAHANTQAGVQEIHRSSLTSDMFNALILFAFSIRSDQQIYLNKTVLALLLAISCCNTSLRTQSPTDFYKACNNEHAQLLLSQLQLFCC